jgi:hypothetical protein
MRLRVATVIVAVALAAAWLTTSITFADRGGTAKVLVLNAPPGYVVAVFQGMFTGLPDSSDPGTATVRSTTPTALNSRATEMFVPVGMPSAVWIWDEGSGFHFLANVDPSDSVGPIQLDATGVLTEAKIRPQEPAPTTSAAFTPSPAASEQTTKILVPNAAPGQVITAFQGEYTPGPQGNDPGSASLESTIPVAADGKVTELFVPTGIPSSVWIWDEQTGYHFLRNVTPGNKSQPIQLDATQAS